MRKLSTRVQITCQYVELNELNQICCTPIEPSDNGPKSQNVVVIFTKSVYDKRPRFLRFNLFSLVNEDHRVHF